MAKNAPTTSAPPLSMTAVAAFFLGVIAAGFEVYVDPAFKPLTVLWGVAAIVVGVMAIFGARRNGLTGSWMAYIGAALGVASIVMLAIWFFS